jgi:hydroxymethylpyrimidine/phosphomethylpyrimidine kinase
VIDAGRTEGKPMTAIALTIAGSDPTSGAGIQADLKTFSALGVYGESAITALVAQNTQGVQAVQEVPTAFIRAQIDSVFSDLSVDAVKIGMLATPAASRRSPRDFRHTAPRTS